MADICRPHITGPERVAFVARLFSRDIVQPMGRRASRDVGTIEIHRLCTLDSQPCLLTSVRGVEVVVQGPETHKHKGIFSGNGVRRFTGGSRPQGHLPRLISDGFGPFFATIRGIFLYVPFLYVPFWRPSGSQRAVTLKRIREYAQGAKVLVLTRHSQKRRQGTIRNFQGGHSSSVFAKGSNTQRQKSLLLTSGD